jgi:hypothetical protein
MRFLAVQQGRAGLSSLDPGLYGTLSKSRRKPWPI